jgi:hypothetical protein
MKFFILRTILYYFVLNKLSYVRVGSTARIHGWDFSRMKTVLLRRQALRFKICGRKIIHIAYVKQWFHLGRHFIYYICNASEFVRCVLSG